MPRDANGNMTLVAGNPVVTGTAISSTVNNNTMADLAAEIQDSLSRSGKGGMSAAFKNADGTESLPGITFTNETSSGWFRNAAGDIRASVLGVWRLAVNALGAYVNGILSIVDATGTKAVKLTAPAGLAADYTLTLPGGLPADTYPVSVSAAGVVTVAQLTNTGQNFGTPSAATDVVIKSYLVETSDSVTFGTGVNGPLSVYKVGKVVTISDKLGFGGTAFSAGNTFATLSAGYRPTNTIYAPVFYLQNSTGNWCLAMLTITSAGAMSFTGVVFTLTGWTGADVLPTVLGDYIYCAFSYKVA